MTNQCSCPNGSYGQKHTQECYESQIERLNRDLRNARETISGLTIIASAVEPSAPQTPEDDFQHWLSYSGKRGQNEEDLRLAYYAGADVAPPQKSTSQPESRVTVGCSQCTATVSLPQHDGRVDIAELGLWYFSTPTGWRCPAHAPAP